ncbi:ribosomal RNA small subunit methyltransferase A [Patescibacteria group bacterium]|jgi:16S rRNA (adenine1518-N6/adenine1519-N6)-dimethyltransferase|nr:ribosomal RNA small subunit methyltransferase A [Patescibacteria group bacterium]
MNVQEILNKVGVKPNKLKGQNFLVDEEVLKKIISSASIKKGENIIEIGPGLGILTNALMLEGANVVAIESQREFADFLRNKFKHRDVDIIVDNAVFAIPKLIIKPPYSVVSNLPYNITSPVINLFLTKVPNAPQKMVLMVQKEVAERLTAPPGSSKRGILTVLIETLCENKEILFFVPPTSFWPQPKVTSAVIRLTLKRDGDKSEVEKTMAVVKAGFSKKRAQLKNALKPHFGNVEETLHSLALDPCVRAEDLKAEDWQKLAYSIKRK